MNNDLSRFQKAGIVLGVVMFLAMVVLVKQNIQRVLVEREAQERRIKQQAEIEQKRQEAKAEQDKREEALRAKITPSPPAETPVVASDTPSPNPSPERMADGDPGEATPSPQGLIKPEVYDEVATNYKLMSRQYRNKSEDYFLHFDPKYVFTENGRSDTYEISHQWVVAQWAKTDRSIQVETAIKGDITITGNRVEVPFSQVVRSDISQNGKVIKNSVFLFGTDTWEWNVPIKK